MDPDAGMDIDPPARGFQVVSKEVTLMPGEEITYCYYFRTPNTEPMAIHKWSSAMTPGSHHMIMFTTGQTDLMPPGTVSASNCDGFGGGASTTNIPVWTYAAQTPTNELALPGDDGAGKPLAQLIPPNTAAFFQMHYLNASDQPLNVHVTLNAEALAANAAYTPTAPFISYNARINIPPGATDDVESGTCNRPADAEFWLMSTHAHKQAVKTEVKDGMPASTTIAFSSTDWEHPGAETWMAAPFYKFDSGKITFECTYNNPTNRTIRAGDSAATDEMCMATGYYFVPGATSLGPKYCYCTGSQCYDF